ncbi:glycosyltransferase, partial [Salipiger thiooxidans]|uniref:glycosyltransferase n=1 Tax=Salipiger thiooxidans TaxID=282683 RepID=UPI001CD4CC3D
MMRLHVSTVERHAFANANTVVVVPARDEEDRIDACLSHLFAQDAPIPAGIVLCVNNSTDETAARALAQARSRCHPLILVEATFASGGVGRARRLGHRIAMRAAPQATVFLSTDADCLPAPCWQREMEAVLARAPAVLGRIDVCGRELASFPASVLLRQRQENAFAALAMEFERLMDPAGPDGIGLNTAGGANLGFRRAAYRSVGGYRPLETGEDRDIINRVRAVGFRPLRAEKAVVLASMRRDGRAPGGMADEISARFQHEDCSVDSALAPFEVMVARHLGHNAAAPRLTLAGARGDLQ